MLANSGEIVTFKEIPFTIFSTKIVFSKKKIQIIFFLSFVNKNVEDLCSGIKGNLVNITGKGCFCWEMNQSHFLDFIACPMLYWKTLYIIFIYLCEKLKSKHYWNCLNLPFLCFFQKLWYVANIFSPTNGDFC